jgi:hypothetical protein
MGMRPCPVFRLDWRIHYVQFSGRLIQQGRSCSGPGGLRELGQSTDLAQKPLLERNASS